VRQEGGTWAFVLHWPESDKRRALVRAGQMSGEHDYDFLGAIPFDCPLDQARAYFEKFVTRFPADATNGVQLIRDRVNKWNATTAESNAQDARELGLELLDANKGNADFAASMGVGTVVTKAQGAGVAGSDVARRTGKSASEIAKVYAGLHAVEGRVFDSKELLKKTIGDFIQIIESPDAATPETIDGVAGLLLLRGDVSIVPPLTQSGSERAARDSDFEKALHAQKEKKAAEDRDAAAANAKKVPTKPTPAPAPKK
jgi:hypothetical protein